MSSPPKPPPGSFTILYFASASALTGKEYETLPAPMPLANLFGELESRYPGIHAKILDSCLVTVNLDYVDIPPVEDADSKPGVVGTELKEGDEVAIIPPVSSG